jgi:hypothetical protein
MELAVHNSCSDERPLRLLILTYVGLTRIRKEEVMTYFMAVWPIAYSTGDTPVKYIKYK